MDELKVKENEKLEIKMQAPEEIEYKKVDFDQIGQDMKTYSTDRSKSDIKRENEAIKVRQTEMKNDYMGSREQMLDSAALLKNSSELLIRDKKWYSLFQAESPEMTRVKESLAYLNKLLDGDVQLDKNGQVDARYLTETIMPAYRQAFSACDDYMTKKKEQGAAKHSTGIRRLEKVTQIYNLLQTEMNNFNIFVNVAFVGVKAKGEVKSVRDLLGEVNVKNSLISRFMVQGNSSNVYRVKTKPEDAQNPEDADKAFYVKKDEKLLNEEMETYTENRLTELRRSKKIREKYKNLKEDEYLAEVAASDKKIEEWDKKVEENPALEENADKEIIKIRAGREELRLEGKIQMADYDNAIEFLEQMQSKITGAQGEKYKEIYTKLLAHDFDKLFREMNEFNAILDNLRNEKGTAGKLIERLEKEKKPGYEAQVEMLRKQMGKNFAPMNELDWFMKRIGCEDEEIKSTLTAISKKEKSGGLFALFTRTLGKEAELFGQQAERSGLTKSDVLASNNTATSRMAGQFGFNDVVTTSFKAKLKFTEVGKTEPTTANVTFSEEAPGEELFQVMADAQKSGKKVRYSSEAIRQMSRMHTFDLMTLQTDRHWRNIKVVVNKSGDDWVIDSMKCYDHDQSFGTKTLSEYFADEKDEQTGEVHTRREGFLTPIMMTVTKNTPLYKYAKKTKMTKEGKEANLTTSLNFMDDIKLPVAKTKSLAKATENYKKQHEGDDQYTTSPWQVINRTHAYMSYRLKMDGDDEMDDGAYMPDGYEMVERRKNLGEIIEKYNPGKKETGLLFFDKLSMLHDMVYAGDSKVSDEKLEDKDKWKELYELFEETYSLYQQLDFTQIDEDMVTSGIQGSRPTEYFTGGKDVVGYMDYNLQGYFYTLKLKFDPSLKEKNTDKNDPGQMKSLNDCQSALAEIKADKINAIKKNLKKSDPSYENDEKKLDEAVEKETEKTARVPAILHMDREAYNSVCDALNSEEYINLMLMDLGMPKSKKNALIERLKEIKAQAEEAEAVVKKWAKDKGLPDDDVRGKFFLDPGDYEKIENITDMALDPGMSYFSSEDTQFLTKDETMSKLMSEGDRQKAREITNDERRTQRQNVGALREEEEYRPLVENGIAKKSEAKK